jgi:hypothetical protein
MTQGSHPAPPRDALHARGVRFSVVSGRLRALTHLDVDAEGIELALERIAAELRRS